MKRWFSLFSFVFLATPLLAQQPAAEDVLRHTTVIAGRDAPNSIPLPFITVELLIGLYGREKSPGPTAAELFVELYGADWSVAEAMVTAIRQTAQTIQETTLADRRAFCARSFADEASWVAASTALDAQARGFRVAEFNRLRDIAGPDVWEKIVAQAAEVSRGAAMLTENYGSIAAETGFELAFANQCGNVSQLSDE